MCLLFGFKGIMFALEKRTDMKKMRREIEASVQGMLPHTNPTIHTLYILALILALVLFSILTFITI